MQRDANMQRKTGLNLFALQVFKKLLFMYYAQKMHVAYSCTFLYIIIIEFAC